MHKERRLSSFLDDEFLHIQSADEFKRAFRESAGKEGRDDWTFEIKLSKFSLSWPWDSSVIKDSLSIFCI